MCALAQPFFTNAPAKLATEWFSVEQRGLATTLGAMFNPIGIAIGQVCTHRPYSADQTPICSRTRASRVQVIPPALVSADGSGLPILLLLVAGLASRTASIDFTAHPQCLICCVSCLAVFAVNTFFFYQNTPPTPPSRSVDSKSQARVQAQSASKSHAVSVGSNSVSCIS